MGRQIAIAMFPQAEASFLVALRSISPVRLYRPRAASAEELEVTAYPASDPPNATFLIWNTAFPWVPQLQTSQPGTRQHPWSRIANYTIGPVLEYTRSLHHSGKGAGRIYWPRVLPQPNPCAYDLVAFEHWYNQLVRWVKQNSVVGTSEQGVTYYLRPPGGQSNAA